MSSVLMVHHEATYKNYKMADKTPYVDTSCYISSFFFLVS